MQPQSQHDFCRASTVHDLQSLCAEMDDNRVKITLPEVVNALESLRPDLSKFVELEHLKSLAAAGCNSVELLRNASRESLEKAKLPGLLIDMLLNAAKPGESYTTQYLCRCSLRQMALFSWRILAAHKNVFFDLLCRQWTRSSSSLLDDCFT